MNKSVFYVFSSKASSVGRPSLTTLPICGLPVKLELKAITPSISHCPVTQYEFTLQSKPYLETCSFITCLVSGVETFVFVFTEKVVLFPFVAQCLAIHPLPGALLLSLALPRGTMDLSKKQRAEDLWCMSPPLHRRLRDSKEAEQRGNNESTVTGPYYFLL
uniref:Phlebovirus_G2 domain-containing protein n=1 Tax=Steinernema glaseri TaxID=37863 RepID=A0A1I7ZWH6_9BILA